MDNKSPPNRGRPAQDTAHLLRTLEDFETSTPTPTKARKSCDKHHDPLLIRRRLAHSVDDLLKTAAVFKDAWNTSAKPRQSSRTRSTLPRNRGSLQNSAAHFRRTAEVFYQVQERSPNLRREFAGCRALSRFCKKALTNARPFSRIRDRHSFSTERQSQRRQADRESRRGSRVSGRLSGQEALVVENKHLLQLVLDEGGIVATDFT